MRPENSERSLRNLGSFISGSEGGRSCAARGNRTSVVKRSMRRVMAAFSGVFVPEKAEEGKSASSLHRIRRVSA